MAPTGALVFSPGGSNPPNRRGIARLPPEPPPDARPAVATAPTPGVAATSVAASTQEVPPVRRLIITLIALGALLAAGCSSGDDDAGDAGATDDAGAESTTTEAAEPAETAPPTTDTIPPEAREIPALQIVFVEFGESGYVEIANVGDEPANVDGIQFCQFPTYFDLGPVAGGPIAPGESIQLAASAVGGLDPSGGEAALYSAPTFNDPTAIFGYVQWGTGGERASVAVDAGIWAAGASVTPDPAFNSIELFGDPADVEAWS